MIYTKKMQMAIKFAIKTHDIYQKQIRKGKGSAYITHPLTAGLILACAGSQENVIVAGILHDTIEDSVQEKKVTREMLTERFGVEVAELVWSVTEEDKNMSWDERKQIALDQIEHFSHESLLVKSADILSNVSELVDDHMRHGDEIFSRFNASKEKLIKHQLEAINAIIRCWGESPLVNDLARLSIELRKI